MGGVISTLPTSNGVTTRLGHNVNCTMPSSPAQMLLSYGSQPGQIAAAGLAPPYVLARPERFDIALFLR